MDMKITSGQMQVALAFVGGYLVGTGKLSIYDVQTVLGAAFPLAAGLWASVSSKRAAVATDAAIAGAVQVAVQP